MGVLFLLGTLSLSVSHGAENAPARFDLARVACLHDIGDRDFVDHDCENVRPGRVSNPNDFWTAHLDVTDETPDESADPSFLPSVLVEKVQFRDLSLGRGVVRVVPTARKVPLPLRC
ncbi:MAG: hypothetical protein ACLP7Q_19810 [Isosphaeraceae bacterium]